MSNGRPPGTPSHSGRFTSELIDHPSGRRRAAPPPSSISDQSPAHDLAPPALPRGRSPSRREIIDTILAQPGELAVRYGLREHPTSGHPHSLRPHASCLRRRDHARPRPLLTTSSRAQRSPVTTDIGASASYSFRPLPPPSSTQLVLEPLVHAASSPIGAAWADAPSPSHHGPITLSS